MLAVLCNEILTALKSTGAKPQILGVLKLLVLKICLHSPDVLKGKCEENILRPSFPWLCISL